MILVNYRPFLLRKKRYAASPLLTTNDERRLWVVFCRFAPKIIDFSSRTPRRHSSGRT
jgi:hypothetical protein